MCCCFFYYFFTNILHYAPIKGFTYFDVMAFYLSNLNKICLITFDSIELSSFDDKAVNALRFYLPELFFLFRVSKFTFDCTRCKFQICAALSNIMFNKNNNVT